jgi:tetratricopeptide (TPR) repeat protein
MPMQIEIPPTLAALTQAIDSMVVPSVEEAVQRGKAALAAYEQLSPEQRAAYSHAIRQDIQTLKGDFDASLNDALHAYPGNTEPEVAVELAHLAVQAGQPDLGHRFLQDAEKLGGDAASADVQDLVAATPAAQPPLAAALTSTDTPPTAEEVNLVGLERLASEDLEGAKAAFENAVDLDPENPEHLNNLALTQLQSGLIRQAAEGAIKALEIEPGLSPANLAVATVALEHAVSWAQEQSNS